MPYFGLSPRNHVTYIKYDYFFLNQNSIPHLLRHTPKKSDDPVNHPSLNIRTYLIFEFSLIDHFRKK